MAKELSQDEKIERSITHQYRRTLWTPFLTALREYELLKSGDHVAVCISGGKDSFLMAKMMQMLARHSDFPFENTFLVMDPGYSEENRKKIEENVGLLKIPVTIFQTRIFDAAFAAAVPAGRPADDGRSGSPGSPCYLCARMRRGALYSKAKELGCNKIALGHHLNDVIETTLLGMCYGSQLQGMMPKLHAQHFEGMELIRPLYQVREDDIIAWAQENHLEFLQCACHFTEEYTAMHNAGGLSRRQEMKALVRKLCAQDPKVEQSLFNSLHDVHIDTFPGFKKDGQHHSFLETYDTSCPGKTQVAQDLQDF